MITLTGKSVFGGVSIGKIAFYKRNEQQIKRWHVDDTESEVKRFEDAKAKGVVVIPLKNVMSAPEIETKLKENGIL